MIRTPDVGPERGSASAVSCSADDGASATLSDASGSRPRAPLRPLTARNCGALAKLSTVDYRHGAERVELGIDGALAPGLPVQKATGEPVKEGIGG
jgi:hypothetical protein